MPDRHTDTTTRPLEDRHRPDPPEAQAWYYMSDGHMVGPCELAELQMSLAVDVLPKDTMVWTPGMKEWEPASTAIDFSEIAPLAAAEIEVSYGIEEETDEADSLPGSAAAGFGVADAVVAALADENPIAHHAHEKVQAAGRADSHAVAVIAELGDTKPHAYRRGFARMIDFTIAGFLLGIVLAIFAPRSPAFDNGAIATFLALLVWAIAEPFVLNHFQTTPGKTLLNIHLRTDEGRSLTLEQSVRRSFRVWFFGMGAGVPLVNLFTMAFARHKLNKEGKTSWDRDGGIVVAHGELDALRVAGIAAFIAFYVLITVISALP